MADPTNAVNPSPLNDPSDESRRQLRRRWELASVLNFLRVFEPVIGKDVKMPAEQIETALINPNHSLAKLHITLLKGIPPVNKNLSNPDAWVTSLCKKLAEWWTWVAEGEVPLTAENGEEISRYKDLDPAIRLSMLKALCELRIEQDDLTSYINDALKEGTDVSHFRVGKISENSTGLTYWYDGDSVMGYRLYKEVNKPKLKSKNRGRACIDIPPTNLEWETLATNLEEFRVISEEFSSSSDAVEGSVHLTLETEIIPPLEKLKKKQERALKRRERQAALINDYQPYISGRTFRPRKQVKYTFDEYDQSIEDAIKVTRDRPIQKVEKNGKKDEENGKRGTHASNGDLSNDSGTEDSSEGSMDEEDEENDNLVVEDSDPDEDNNKNDDTKDSDNDAGNSDSEDGQRHCLNLDAMEPQGQNGHSLEPRNLRAKKRVIHSPTPNSALESFVVPDSDDASSGECPAQVSDSEDESPAQVSDSEDERSS